MAWIESHDSLKDHPKLARLCRALQINQPQAIGHLHLLWWWTLKYAPDGDLSRFEEWEIALAAGWQGEPHDFILAMLASGFADPAGEDPCQGIKLHDWQDYGGKLHRRRQAEAERKRERRDSTSGGHPADVLKTSGGRPLRHDMTRHDMTRHEDSTKYMPGSRAEKNLEPDPFDDEPDPHNHQDQAEDSVVRIFQYYRDAIQPHARICPTDKIRARLKRFQEEEILTAIRNFAADRWCMKHNGNRGAPWFFHSDARIEQYLLMGPGQAQDTRSNGKHKENELSDECLESIRTITRNASDAA